MRLDVKAIVLAAALLLAAPSSALAEVAQTGRSGRGAEPQAPPSVARPSRVPRLDSLLQELRRRHDVPALAAAVVRPDSIVRIGAVGVRRRGRADRVTVHDRFHIGSNTKAMTATVLAVVVEEGGLAWDATLGEAFPGRADSTAAAYRDVTLAELLSHQAGVPPFTEGGEFQQLPTFGGSPRERRAAFARWLLRRGPAYPSGTKYSYSNAGYALATAMAEAATGQSWEEMMRTRLFEPLGIDGGFGWPAAGDRTGPWGHWTPEGDSLVAHDPNGAYHLRDIVAPAGDVHLSIGGYARFLREHLRGLSGEETALLEPAIWAHLHAPKVDMHEDDGRGVDLGYALGWAVRERGGTRESFHTGSAGPFFARAVVRPERGLAVAVLVNAGGERAQQASEEAARTLLDRYGGRE